MDSKIIKNPLGWKAGAIDPAWQVLWNISIEMMAHRSDLLEEGRRELEKDKFRLSPKIAIAMVLEKYAAAITIAAVQMMTPDQRAHNQLSGLEELAAKHELFLPDEFKTKKDGE